MTRDPYGALVAGYAAAAAVAYLAIFSWGGAGGPTDHLLAAASNAAPLVPLGLAARAVLIRWALGRPSWISALVHVGAGTAFTAVWYWSVLTLLALFSGQWDEAIVLRRFPEPAEAWQWLQGATIFVLLAVAAKRGRETAAEATEPVGSTRSQRYLLRCGDELVPVQTSAIVSIAGADDYAEVLTAGGRRLVRTRLAEFESTLDPDAFVRVHRSWIVNLDRLLRAEPAGGGRLTLHMSAGPPVVTSRAGARLLRDRMI